MTHWSSLFEQQRQPEPPTTGATTQLVADGADETAPPPDPRAYQPWLIQRGRTRPAMLLDFRRFDPKSGLLMGCQMPYMHLAGIEYIGDRMVTLDFGLRQFVVEGVGLAELVRHLQQGTVLAVQEHSERIWPQVTERGIVTRIVKVDARAIGMPHERS